MRCSPSKNFNIQRFILKMETVDVVQLRNQFLINLKKREQRSSSLALAVETVKLLRKLIIHEKCENVGGLLDALANHGRFLWAADPSEIVLKNSVLMVCKLVREENMRILCKSDEPLAPYDSLNKLWQENQRVGAASIKKLKKVLIEHVKEIGTEMELCRELIANQASELIQPQDVLIVHSLNSSATLDQFLSVARKTRKHRVFSVGHSSETTPEFATPLALSEVGGRICEATKVILPGVVVFPDGSCLVPAGGLSLCLAAQRHSVPVYVLAAFYKITPFFVPDLSVVNTQKSPGLPFSMARQFKGKVDVLSPIYDMIPSSLVTLYVSNTASVMPSHIYRLIGDYYHPEDVANC